VPGAGGFPQIRVFQGQSVGVPGDPSNPTPTYTTQELVNSSFPYEAYAHDQAGGVWIG